MFPFCWACSEAGEIAIDLVLTQLKWFNDRSIDLWGILQKFQIVFDQGKFWHCLHCVSLQWLVNNTNTTRATQTTLVWLCRFGISISIIIKALLHNRVLFTNFSPQLQLWLFSSSMSQHTHEHTRTERDDWLICLSIATAPGRSDSRVDLSGTRGVCAISVLFCCLLAAICFGLRCRFRFLCYWYLVFKILLLAL